MRNTEHDITLINYTLHLLFGFTNKTSAKSHESQKNAFGASNKDRILPTTFTIHIYIKEK